MEDLQPPVDSKECASKNGAGQWPRKAVRFDELISSGNVDGFAAILFLLTLFHDALSWALDHDNGVGFLW